MPWVKLDDRIFDHPKLTQLGPEAKLLHLAAIVWVGQNLTDGAVPEHALPLIAAKAHARYIPKAHRYAGELVAAGLWDREPGGWQVHDYLDWNESRAQTDSRRNKAATKKANQRKAAARGSNGQFAGIHDDDDDDDGGIEWDGMSPGLSPPMSPGDMTGDMHGDSPGPSPPMSLRGRDPYQSNPSKGQDRVTDLVSFTHDSPPARQPQTAETAVDLHIHAAEIGRWTA